MGSERKRGIMISVTENIITFATDGRQSIMNHRWVMIITLLIASMGITGNFCSANIVDFQSFSWDTSDQHIIRNGAPIVEPATDTIPDVADGEDFFYVQSSYDIYNDISFSGAGAGNPQIYSHVYNYTNPYQYTYYTSTNTTGHSRSYNFSSAEMGHRNVATFRDSIILNGSLILADNEPHDEYEGYRDYGTDQEGESNGNSLEGLLATFDVLVTRETLRKNGKIRSRNLLKGSVILKGQADGSYKIKTKGNIKKKHIDQITINDGLIVAELNDKIIFYSTRVRANKNFSIITTVTSTAHNIGDGTGAEVIFGPGDPTIPVFFANGEVPEPATILLLSAGALLGLRRRRKR